ncbi:MAG: hypothetical protein P1P85_03500 [Patescibacteria group bacterium]|nr:hypothetical protein [Patescibacteria group bacterium]
MSSINLLPTSIKIKSSLKKQRRDIFLISFFMIFISTVLFIGFYYEKAMAQKKIEDIDLKLDKLDVEIKDEIDKKKSPLAENKINESSNILQKHYYYSRALKFIQKIINKDVYLLDGAFQENEDSIIFDFSAVAENYSAAVNQIAVFKNYYLVNKVVINGININSNQEAEFDGQLKLKKDTILYHRNYWDFGLSMLSFKTDRYIKINNFSANMKEIPEKGEILEVEFDGIAYDLEKIASLEGDFQREFKTIINEVFICCEVCFMEENSEKEKYCGKEKYLNEKEYKGFVEFNGLMRIKY